MPFSNTRWACFLREKRILDASFDVEGENYTLRCTTERYAEWLYSCVNNLLSIGQVHMAFVTSPPSHDINCVFATFTWFTHLVNIRRRLLGNYFHLTVFSISQRLVASCIKEPITKHSSPLGPGCIPERCTSKHDSTRRSVTKEHDTIQSTLIHLTSGDQSEGA